MVEVGRDDQLEALRAGRLDVDVWLDVLKGYVGECAEPLMASVARVAGVLADEGATSAATALRFGGDASVHAWATGLDEAGQVIAVEVHPVL